MNFTLIYLFNLAFCFRKQTFPFIFDASGVGNVDCAPFPSSSISLNSLKPVLRLCLALPLVFRSHFLVFVLVQRKNCFLFNYFLSLLFT